MAAFSERNKFAVGDQCGQVSTLLDAPGKNRTISVNDQRWNSDRWQNVGKVRCNVVAVDCCRQPGRQFTEFFDDPIGACRTFTIFKIFLTFVDQAVDLGVEAFHVVVMQSLAVPFFRAEGEGRHIDKS